MKLRQLILPLAMAMGVSLAQPAWSAIWSSDEVATPAPSSERPPATVIPATPSTDTLYEETEYAYDEYDEAEFTQPASATPEQAIDEAVTALTEGGEYDFGDFSSQALTVRAWESLILEDYPAVDVYVQKCIQLYEAKAREQGAALSAFAPADQALQFWALNDVATSYFIWGRSFSLRKRYQEARDTFDHLIKSFPYAQAWDSRGWFWKVAEAAKDQLTTLGTPYDYGDYTSQVLATKGWQALENKDYKGVELYAKKCIKLYEAEAHKQQAGMMEFASKEKAFEPWALNDVAVSYFLLGEAYAGQKKFREARAAYQKAASDFGFAQCWDPKGWFWKVAIAAKGRLRKVAAQEKRGW